MGATDIKRSVSGRFSEERVKKEVKKWNKEDKKAYGNNGYTGSWAEVDCVKFSAITFDTYESAREHAESMVAKYEPAIAVKYTENKKTFWLISACVPC